MKKTIRMPATHRLVQLGTKQEMPELLIRESRDRGDLELRRNDLDAAALAAGFTPGERRHAVRTLLQNNLEGGG